MLLSLFSRAQTKEFILILGPAIALIAGAFWLAFQFVEPAPPNTIRIASAGAGGGYEAFAQRYAEVLENSGIKVEVLNSAGSVENLARLQKPPASATAAGQPTLFAPGNRQPETPVRADLALLQGGVITRLKETGRTVPDIVSLGRVFVEPLWIFYRDNGTLNRISKLQGKRLAVGMPGSGTLMLVEAMLNANAITTTNTTFELIGGDEAGAALLKGQVDAAFLTRSPDSQLVIDLLRDPDIKVMSLRQAEAYTRLFPYLTKVTLPAGVIDLVGEIPRNDIDLVAAKAAVVARSDLHPAIISLMIDALQQVHGDGGMFQRVGDFPRAYDPELEISSEAKRVYENGPTFLKRYLPFWLASFIERMFVLAIPVATIMIPLFQVVPWIYETRIKTRIFHWFEVLRALEKRFEAAGPQTDSQAFCSEILAIDRAVSNIPVPWHHADKYYELKAAVDLVRQRIDAQARSRPAEDAVYAAQ